MTAPDPVLRSRFVRALGAVVLVVLGLGACNDDEDLLEQACRVIVEDCGEDLAVGWCIDAIGNQTPRCLNCIVESGCDFGSVCSDESVRCNLPPGYLPIERVDGGPEHPTGRPRPDASADAARTD